MLPKFSRTADLTMGFEDTQAWGEETRERTEKRKRHGSTDGQRLPSVLRCPRALTPGTHTFRSSPEARSCTSQIPHGLATAIQVELATLFTSGQLSCPPVALTIPAVSQQTLSSVRPPSAGRFTPSVLFSRFPDLTSYLATLDQLIHYKASITASIPMILKSTTPSQNSPQIAPDLSILSPGQLSRNRLEAPQAQPSPLCSRWNTCPLHSC